MIRLKNKKQRKEAVASPKHDHHQPVSPIERSESLIQRQEDTQDAWLAREYS